MVMIVKLSRRSGSPFKVHDVRDDRRWKVESKVFGESGAYSRALRRIFENEHYSKIVYRNKQQRKWGDYMTSGCIDDLVATARDLFELVQNETNGVIRFVPGTRMWQEGIYTCVDIEGKGKKGYPISWNVVGSERLFRHLYLSSDVESEIWRRLANGRGKPNREVKVFGKTLSPVVIAKYLGEYHRSFGSTYNGMPVTVESAFNHVPQLEMPLKVKGFPYPHKMPKMVFA